MNASSSIHALNLTHTIRESPVNPSSGPWGEVDRSLHPARLEGLHFTGAQNFRILPGEADATLTFDDGFGEVTSTQDRAVARALEIFADFLPGSTSLDDLAEGPAREPVAGAFMAMLCRNLIHASVLPTGCAVGPLTRPRAWGLAASDAAAGETIVATPRHEKFALDGMGRLVLPLCDGSRTRADLIDAVAQVAQSGAMQVRDAEGAVISDPERLRGIAERAVDGAMRAFAKAGLFVD